LLACVIVASVAFGNKFTEESRLHSWGKGDLIGRKGDLKVGCIDCGLSKGLKGRWTRSVDEEENDDDLIEEENKMRSHGGLSRSNSGNKSSGRKGREEDLETEESKTRSLGGVSSGKGGNQSSGRKGRNVEDDETIEIEEKKMQSQYLSISRHEGRSNSGRKGRTMEEDIEAEESKINTRSHGVRLGNVHRGDNKINLKQIVGRGKL